LAFDGPASDFMERLDQRAPAGGERVSPAFIAAVASPSQDRSASLDHLVGAGEDRGRNGEAERLGCLEVDHQLEPRRHLDW
jgi:hypothetical protein